MASVTPTIFRGIVVPDPRVTWARGAISATSEAGPIAGVPVPTGDTSMVLRSHGTQDVAKRARVIRGGHPGAGAAVVWRDETDDTDEYRGWDAPHVLSGFNTIAGSTTADKWRIAHTVALSDGRIAVASTKDLQIVTVHLRDPDTGAWTEEEVYDQGSPYVTTEAWPCLLQMPSGRLVCFFWREHDSGGSVQLRMYYRTDAGSWVPGQKGCFDDAIDTSVYVPGRMRAVEAGGLVALFADMEEQATPEGQVWQWVSTDLGASFVYVDALEGQARGGTDAVVHDGVVIVGYASDFGTTGSSVPPYVRRLALPSTRLSDGEAIVAQAAVDGMEWGTVSGSILTSAELALVSDADGRLWIIGRDHGGGENYVGVKMSDDGGLTWQAVGSAPAGVIGAFLWRGRDGATYPRRLTAASHRGRVMVGCQPAASPGTRDPSLVALWCGGWTSVCAAQQSSARPAAESAVGAELTYLPFDLPEDVGNGVPVWVATSSGSRTLDDAGLHLSTGIAQAEWSDTGAYTGGPSSPLTVRAEVRVDAGAAQLRLRQSDATPLAREIVVEVTPTGITMSNGYGGTTIGTVATTAADGAPIQLLAELDGSAGKVWWRAVGADGDALWSLVGSTAVVISDASNPGARVRFGQGASSESWWSLVSIRSGQFAGIGTITQVNPSDLAGRDIGADPVYIDGGLSLSAVDGPAWRNDEWTVTPDYSYPIRAVLGDVASSPRREWRSTTDSTQADIVIDLGPSVDTVPMGALLAVMLVGGNFPQALLARNTGGAWAPLATLDRTAGTSLAWSRKDEIATSRVSAGAGAMPWYAAVDALRGSYFAMEGEGETVKTRMIATNGAGRWGPLSSGLQPRLFLDSIDGTEGISGAAGAIWMRDTVHLVPITQDMRKLRIRIPAASTAEGYFRLGALVVGHFHPTGAFASEPGWGMVREWASDWESVESRAGIRNITKLSPNRRAVEIAWADGSSSQSLASDVPLHVLGWAGGPAVAVPGDVAWTVPGILSQLDGAVRPMGYIAACPVPTSSSDVIDITDPSLLLYGRVLTQTLRVDQVVGTPETGEIIRVGTVRMVEEV